jgi:hypothetical protein
VQRLPELVQHVVRRIDDVADGPQAGARSGAREPFRARTDRHAADDEPVVARAQRRRPRWSRVTPRARRSAPADARSGTAPRAPGQSPAAAHVEPSAPRDLARHADVRQQVRPVRRDVDDEARVVEADALDERAARLELAVQLQDAVVVAPSPSSRALHSMPWLSSPRIFALRIVTPPGSDAPTGANG